MVGRHLGLCGAGAAGKLYYKQLKATKHFDIVVWVDKNWDKY